MRRLLPLAAAVALAATPGLADQTVPINVNLRVGTTKRLWVVAAHRADCSSDPARSVEVRSSPSLGELSQQEGVPSVMRHSISGTCLGAHVTGIGVDYTARQAGTDRFEFDGIFANGAARYLVTAHNR